MTLTSEQLLDLYATPAVTEGLVGRVSALRRFHAGGRGSASDRLLEALVDDAKGLAPTPEPHHNPTQGWHTLPDGARKPLEPADLIWLQRLPVDPAAVGPEEAKTLARLSSQVSPNSSDARLVESIFTPVRRLYESREAAARVKQLQQLKPLPIRESLAVDVLASVIARETPELTAEEATQRAFAGYNAARRRAAQELDNEIAAAREKAA